MHEWIINGVYGRAFATDFPYWFTHIRYRLLFVDYSILKHTDRIYKYLFTVKDSYKSDLIIKIKE